MQSSTWLQRKFDSKLEQSCTEDEDFAQVRKAVLVLVISTFLTKTADTLANPKITLTALLQSLGASVFAVSLLVPLREAGALLPQVWLANFTNRYQRLGPLYSLGTGIQGLAAVGMMLSAWLLDGTLAGWVLIGCLAVLSIARALCSITYKAVLGKMVPGGLRGQTTGWASSAAGLATILISCILLFLSEQKSASVLIVFVGTSAVCWWLAAALFTRLDEAEQPSEQSGSESVRERLGLLRDDTAFRQFVIVRSLLVSTALVAPWYVMLSVSNSTALGSVGALLLASGLASFASSPIWGQFSDRSSRWVLKVAALCVAALGAIAVALFNLVPNQFGSLWLVPSLYFLLEVAHQGVRIGRKTYVVDIATDDNRVDYVALSNTLIGIIIIGMGMVTGLIAVWLSPISMIALFSLIAGIAAFLAHSLPEALETNDAQD